MKESFKSHLRSASTLSEVGNIVVALLKEQKQQALRLGYVSGVITSDGPDHVTANIKRLEDFTERLRNEYGFPIFGPTDIFTDELYERIDAQKVGSADFQKFWRDILTAGHVTDVFMTPRWEVSGGARDEHQVAKSFNLTVYYIEE